MTMTSSAPLACALCSVKFEDLDSLLQHMAGHTVPTASSAAPAGVGQQGGTRRIVLSRTAFLRLKPLLQQGAGRGVVTIVTQRGGVAGRGRAIRPRPPQPQPAPAAVDSSDSLDVEIIEPAEPPQPAVRAVRHTRPDDPDTIECRVCKRRFKHKYSLVAHCRQHMMSRLCGVCHRRLPDGQALVEHLETHMEKNSSFKCDQCDKSFVHAKSLYVHKRNHSGVRPYTCQYCMKTFRHWHKHRVHVRIHTGERPYRCDVCGWGFPRNDECKRHMRTHVGRKSFHCIDCGVGCGTQLALMRHQELHHGKSMLPAPDDEQESTESAEEGERDATEPATAADADGELETYADLDDKIMVKIEMEDASSAKDKDGKDDNQTVADADSAASGDGEDEDEPCATADDATANDANDGEDDGVDSDDPPYRPESDSDSDASVGADPLGSAPADAIPTIGSPAAIDQEKPGKDLEDEETDPLAGPLDQPPQEDPIGIDLPPPEDKAIIEPTMVIKAEPTDEDEEPTAKPDSPVVGAPWDSDSDSEMDDTNVNLLEPEVSLTELFIDIERMRSTIRRKIAANAHKFDDTVAKEARTFVQDPEPNIDHMRSILRAKLEEGKRIQALLSQQETEKRTLNNDLEVPNKKIKLEPVDSDEDRPTLKSYSTTSASTTINPDASRPDMSRMRGRWLAPGFPRPGERIRRRRGRPPSEATTGRTSDPRATPRVPRRRWIQHELNFEAADGTLDEGTPLQDVRISTGFGELGDD